MSSNNMTRYTINDVANNQFYQMPKFLFGDKFNCLSNSAKVLYSLLRDRHQLSLMNNWINENGEVFLIFTRDNMCEMLKCSQPTIRKIINELKTHGLMEEERLGLNKPNRIYLTVINHENPTVTRSENQFHSKVKNGFRQKCNLVSGNKTDVNKTYYNNYIPQHHNFEQRQYSVDDYEQFYSNYKMTRSDE